MIAVVMVCLGILVGGLSLSGMANQQAVQAANAQPAPVHQFDGMPVSRLTPTQGDHAHGKA